MRTNETGLKKVMDMTRLISVAVLLLHYYDSCYLFFWQKGWTHAICDRILDQIHKTGLLDCLY